MTAHKSNGEQNSSRPPPVLERKSENKRAKEETSRTRKRVKRYSLVLPEELYTTIQELADDRGTTVLEIFRRFIKLGLIAAELENDPNKSLIIREGDKEREIILI
ncbi:MAG: hypothetical protein IPK17_11130 [Chloroflexi bacterium]|uniref:hypothetical protein n=1 Tax=Candidatus Flexifilum breve TaxID=3140694 RepID=UPI003136E839|nr:hypothetical protein [Chloroflexota bacterium]